MLVWIAEGCGGVCGVDEHPSRSFGERRGIVGEWQHLSRSFGEQRGCGGTNEGLTLVCRAEGVWGTDESPHTRSESGGVCWVCWVCGGSNEGPCARMESGGAWEGSGGSNEGPHARLQSGGCVGCRRKPSHSFGEQRGVAGVCGGNG